MSRLSWPPPLTLIVTRQRRSDGDAQNMWEQMKVVRVRRARGNRVYHPAPRARVVRGNPARALCGVFYESCGQLPFSVPAIVKMHRLLAGHPTSRDVLAALCIDQRGSIICGWDL